MYCKLLPLPLSDALKCPITRDQNLDSYFTGLELFHGFPGFLVHLGAIIVYGSLNHTVPVLTCTIYLLSNLMSHFLAKHAHEFFMLLTVKSRSVHDHQYGFQCMIRFEKVAQMAFHSTIM